MFVSDNSVKSAKHYFNDRLKEYFSGREIRMMFQLALQKRLNLTDSDLLLSDELRLSESDLLYFRSIVKRLLDNEPFQYIFGETEFYGLVLKTDNRALIPRPETEELVDWILKSHQNLEAVVDVCSGSGCIALALKNNLSKATVSGIDVSAGALALSKENAQLNQLNVHFLQFDVLNDAFPFEDDTLDLIVSNPPYVLENEKAEMQKHVLDHEPHLALFVENDNPLIFYRKITSIAKEKLKVGGWLYFEINEQFGEEMSILLQEYGFVLIELSADLQGKNRMIRAQK